MTAWLRARLRWARWVAGVPGLRAALRFQPQAHAAVATVAVAVDAVVLLLLLKGAAQGPQSARRS